MSDYSLLEKTYEYDKNKAAQLANALNELADVESRKKYLEKLVKENRKLKPFIWKTADNKHMALHTIETDHLNNIINMMLRKGLDVDDEILAEARSRKLPIGGKTAVPIEVGALSSNDPVVPMMFRNDDFEWPNDIYEGDM